MPEVRAETVVMMPKSRRDREREGMKPRCIARADGALEPGRAGIHAGHLGVVPACMAYMLALRATTVRCAPPR